MTSTDELRRLLNERGVKYFHDDYGLHKETRWTFGSTGVAIYVEYEKSGNKHFSMVAENDYSPEQAIAATLGSGECEMETDWDYLHDGIPDAPEDTWAYKCSACDWSFRYDRGIKPNFCPNCGKTAKS